MAFVHLHVHTEFSFLDGASTLEGLVQRVVDIGQTAVAITDHGEVSGHLKFQQAANDVGIQPIYGMEGYFVDDVAERIPYNYKHITLLAISQVGLTNLWKLSSRAYTEGMHYKPRIDFEMLRDHSEGIIATGGCLGGCIANYLIEGEDQYDPGMADERIGRFMDILDDRFYLELHTFPDDKQRQVNKALVEKAGMFGVPLLAVSDSHYLRPEDWEMHELLTAAGMKKKHNDPTRFQYGYGALHLMDENEVFEKLSGHLPESVVREAMNNTVKIAKMAEGVHIEGNRTFPVFLESGADDEEMLKRDAWKMFDERLSKLGIESELKEEYRQRLDRELDLVINKGYAGYFLITADIVRWSKNKGFLMGPGRGSAGGSLLSYVLGITEIDPVANGLLFERFLDPELKSLPDIDIDVPQLERHKVLERLHEQYGDSCVAGIGTLMTLKPKVLLNDFCRTLSISFDDNKLMGKIIDTTPDLVKDDMTWPEVYEYNEKSFAPWVKKYPKLFELMNAFAAHYRQAGAHAAAVVVNREPLFGKLPMRVKEDEIRTQVPMEDVEALGYMKMDFLGLRTLSTLMRALEMAQKNWTPESGKPEPVHFYEWQYNGYYNDDEVYKSLWLGKNLGVFQIETPGVTEVAKRYDPRNLEDMCAIVSLFRPGLTRSEDPETKLTLLELFLQKREGRRGVTFHHHTLESILGNTFGAFLYQEQIMQTVRDLGDFTPEEQTKVRKILGKKKAEEMKKLKGDFIGRSTAKGISQEAADAIWNDMEKFGEYGFNKSHGFAYGMIAYWCAWMKYHYTEEFMCALFQTVDDTDKITLYNRECRRLDISVLGPDINESESDFILVNGRIRYGLQGVRNVGEASSKAVQENRPYASATDAVTRLDKTKANKKTLESMILVGALDSIVTEEDCEGLPSSWSPSKVALYRLFRSKLTIGVKKDAGLDERGIFQKYLPEFQDYADKLQIDDLDANEPLYLGDHVTTIPFGKYIDAAIEHFDYRGYEKMGVSEHAVIAGTVGEIRETKVKKEGPNKGREMAWIWLEFPVLEDGKVIDVESRRLVCFPKEYTYVQASVEEGAPVIMKVEKLADSNGYEGGLCIQSVYRIDRGEYPGSYMASKAMVSVSDDPTQAPGYWD